MDIWNDPKFEHILAIIGALVPLASAAASFLNHMVRAKQANGEAVSPMLLAAGSALNAASINLDKAVQLGRMVKGGSYAPAQAPAPAPAPEALPAPAPVPEAAPAFVEAPPEPLPVVDAPKKAARMVICPACNSKFPL